MFRILQEAIANVLKHANARTVKIRLVRNIDTYELVITDDGIGISSEPTVYADTYGLHAMHERAQRIGGRIELLSLSPGTAVRVVISRMEIGGETNDSGIGG